MSNLEAFPTGDGGAGSRPGWPGGWPPSRALHWQLPRGVMRFDEGPRLMGILNVTPDSFSDGGKWFDPAAAIEQGLKLIRDGADLLDVGGESTRPFSQPVSAAEELQRVIPVIRELRSRTEIPISIDTSKAVVASAAIEAGADILNDVTALRGDPAMLPLAVQSGVAVCAMHMQGTPQTMQVQPQYQNVVEEVREFLRHTRQHLLAGGLHPAKICLDPGIGFGKSHSHNLQLIRQIEECLGLEVPLLVGHSRKGFIGKLLGDLQADRDAATLGVSLFLAARGVQILRVHEVANTRAALQTFLPLWAPAAAPLSQDTGKTS